jgi:hypothetical protein
LASFNTGSCAKRAKDGFTWKPSTGIRT